MVEEAVEGEAKLRVQIFVAEAEWYFQAVELKLE